MVSALWFLIKQEDQDSKKGEQKCIRSPERQFRTNTWSHPLNSIGFSRPHVQPKPKECGNGLFLMGAVP